MSILTGGSTAISVRPCTRLMTAGPGGVRDPVPNRQATLKAVTQDGFSRSSVRPIVISFSCFMLASARGSVGYRRVSSDCHARHRGPCQSGHLVSSISTETARWFDRLKLAKIEVTDRLQHLAVALSCRFAAGFPARRHIRLAGLQAQRLCRARGGLGCDGRLDDRCLLRALRGSEPGFGVCQGSITD
jgi:hypothetical protein